MKEEKENNNFKKNGENFWNLIEKKWLNYWDSNKINNSDVDYNKQKFFITVAYPYPNSPQHIGHGRTYTLADVHARYYKLKGLNVLFPMGFHYTGTPILGMSKRVQSGDKEIIDNFKKIYLIDQNTINSFVDPLNIAKYFHNEIKSGMIEMGYSIDWRREFTTIDPFYKKFISWQFKTLKELGVIEQGSHPVGWCPNDENPVSQHDTLGDIEPTFTEYILIKFRLADEEIYLPVATLRPETIFGVTNLWINNEEKYLKILVDNNETWIVSKSAAKKLEFQNHNLKNISEISGSDLIGQLVRNPETKSLIPILPASFVTMDDGSGIVMSVPAHAPFDMQALIDIKKNYLSYIDLFKKIDIKNIEPITIINSNFEKIINENKYEKNELIIPSSVFLNKYSIIDQNDTNLEKATSDLYSLEFYDGVMNGNTPYLGLPVSKAKEKIKQDVLQSNHAIIFYELTNKPVFCRCGSLCYVKILNNQWFLNYGNKKWKELAFKCIDRMEIIPHEIVGEFKNVFDWLKERACARKSGLGTELPWDKGWIIESLSDSVIYMIYYIIAKYVNTKNLEYYENLIDDSFFNYIIYNKKNKIFEQIKDDGTLLLFGNEFYKNDDEKITEKNKNKNYLKSFLNLSFEIKKEFEYYYPLDSRHSGRDLIPNHLSFFIFNHSILFPQNLWPKQIVVNGSVLMDGKKMSKSMGNIIPLRQAIKKYSADSIRVAMLVLGELLQDVDFSFSMLKGIYTKLNEIYDFSVSFYNENNTIIKSIRKVNNKENKISDLESIGMEDKWFLSRINHHVSEISNSFDKLKTRESINTALYLMDKDFEWYKKRKFAKIGKLYHDKNDIFIIYTFLINRIKILSPFCPFLSEELWHIYGNSDSIFNSSWPSIEKKSIEDSIYEENELYITNIIDDINKIIKITKKNNNSINKILIYLSSEEKNFLYSMILKQLISQNKNKNFGEVMKSLLANSKNDVKVQNTVKNNTEFIKKTIEDILSLTPEDRERKYNIGKFEESRPLDDAISLLSHEYEVPCENILIFNEDQQKEIIDLSKKAKFSRPFKPAILIQ
ncbi:MAG: leucine--tRNA ligase [Nitrosopumilus sp.]|nr:leucine--tRNA ligase [Nitrosopumilus sp.]